MTKIEENTMDQVLFEDQKEYETRVRQYEGFISAVNNTCQALAEDGIIMNYALLDTLFRKGTDAIVEAIKQAFETKKSKVPDALKESLQFNPAKYYGKYQNHINTLNWSASNLRIDTSLLGCKNGEVFLPEKSKQKIKEWFTVRIVNENQRVIVELLKQIRGSCFELAGVLKAQGFHAGQFIHNEQYGLLEPDFETGELRVNFLPLNMIK